MPRFVPHRVGTLTFVFVILQLSQAARPAVPVASHCRQELLHGLIAAAIEQTHHTVRYDPAYVRIPYPGGDVPADTGVCTDVVIRAYRAVGVDLQEEVHEDMLHNFGAYPRERRWLSASPDSNIDHWRVPNLMVFFGRKGESLPITSRTAGYSPGDLVTGDGGGVFRISEYSWTTSHRKAGGL